MAKAVLQGKVAIITGAGSPLGIGHAIALHLVRAGARVAGIETREREGA
jgi:NAD(P)-dependent dehydrogenase (short-subunit alcohol dehydrogenase family)